MKSPLDTTPYEQDPRSKPIELNTPDGCYVYVQDENGVLHVVPDGPHLHPKVLGHAKPAMYAGDVTVRAGRIVEVTNLSGTFAFDDEEGLLSVADSLEQIGFTIEKDAVRFFPVDGSAPVILQ